MFVNQAYDRTWCAANDVGEPGKLIEAILRMRVENPVTAQSIEPLGLVFGYWIVHAF
jgi:hypothetical protein